MIRSRALVLGWALGVAIAWATLDGGASATLAAAPTPFLGNWALTIPGGGAGWLGVVEKDGKLESSILWGGGSVVPVTETKMVGDDLVLIRRSEIQRKDKSGKQVKAVMTQTITAKAAGDVLTFQLVSSVDGGKPGKPVEFKGKKIPPLPPAPVLKDVRFGPAITLFNGKDLEGWKLTNPKALSGWSVENGLLTNRPVQEKGKPHKHYGNLRTEKEFEDFNLTLEVCVPQGGNSGIYLRGIYEVQVTDSFGKPLDTHHMGAIYSRIRPSVNAEKPGGQWQKLDITLVDRHVTVILNGTKIVDNQPLLGCTGGALTSDEFCPGPLYLQGDHTGVEYRNIVLRPVVK